MADHLSMKILTGGALSELRSIDRRADRGTMWALREVGRKVKQEAKRSSPVYKGDDPRAVKGAYKKSISSSRRLTRHGVGDYSLLVGPRGDKVHLYAKKIEDEYQPMRTAYDRVSPQIRAIHERAWSRAIHRK